MRHLFLNGPVQNGPFTFEAKPGKVVGIRLAAALNAILGAPPAPHLWNTVTLEGDLRHRLHTDREVTRQAFEADLVAAKYPSGRPPGCGTVTDADTEVAALALEMIENNLRAGTLVISRETVTRCRACGHLTGTGTHPCATPAAAPTAGTARNGTSSPSSRRTARSSTAPTSTPTTASGPSTCRAPPATSADVWSSPGPATTASTSHRSDCPASSWTRVPASTSPSSRRHADTGRARR